MYDKEIIRKTTNTLVTVTRKKVQTIIIKHKKEKKEESIGPFSKG